MSQAHPFGGILGFRHPPFVEEALLILRHIHLQIVQVRPIFKEMGLRNAIRRLLAHSMYGSNGKPYLFAMDSVRYLLPIRHGNVNLLGPVLPRRPSRKLLRFLSASRKNNASDHQEYREMLPHTRGWENAEMHRTMPGALLALGT